MPDDALIGTTFAQHRIDELVGRGGMGAVYRATDLMLGRVTAIKVIHPALAVDPGFRRRFISECRLAATIDHPNVVDIFQAGEHEGVLFAAMRFVDGHDLRTRLTHAGALAPPVAVGIATQVAAALDAAHARGLVHRDVKPGNVLLGAGDRVFLTDFGLSRRLADDSDDTAPAGAVVGTLNYIAPEQIDGNAGIGADVYALGCVVFELLTGSVPFPERGFEAKLLAHRRVRPPTLHDVRPDVPKGLDAVVQRALRKAPGERQPSAGTFADELQAALEASMPRARAARALDPDLAALVSDATAALRRVKSGARLRAAIADTARAVQHDRDELASNPPAQLREKLRAELLRGSSPRVVEGLKRQVLALQNVERRCAALLSELERQVLELDRLVLIDEREVAERVATLRASLAA